MKEHSFYLKDDRTLIGNSVLGVAGENLSEEIVISVPLFWGSYDLKEATFKLSFHNSEDFFAEYSPESVTEDERIFVKFPVTREMCAVAGEVKIQLLVFVGNEVVIKSNYAKMSVGESAVTDAQISSTFPTEIQQMKDILEQKADKSEVEELSNTKADKSEVEQLSNTKADKSELESAVTVLEEKINSKSDAVESILISGKADKVNNPVGNIAGLDENGNLCDSEYSLQVVDGVFSVLKNGERIISFERELAQPNTWEDIKNIVRAGRAQDYFALGDVLSSQKGDETLYWEVIGFDHDTPSDETLTHSMTLLLKDIYTPFAADVEQAIYIFENDCEPGKFYIDLSAGIYSFTITKNIVAGSQLLLNRNYSYIALFGDCYSNSGMEYCTLTKETEAPQDAIELTPLNHLKFAFYGKYEYLNSPLRLWLNSEKEDWWEPTSQYSREHYFSNTLSGFLYGMEQDFLNAVGKVKKKVSGANGLTSESDELFFILARGEVSDYSSVFEGNCYPIFTNSESRKRSYNGAVTRWRLRTPRYDLENSYYDVDINGNINHGVVNNSDGVLAACCIV